MLHDSRSVFLFPVVKVVCHAANLGGVIDFFFLGGWGAPRKSTVEKALARAEAIRHKADKRLSRKDRAQAEALEKTAASLSTLVIKI